MKPTASNSDLDAIAAAFSRKAAQYDAFGEGHPILERMRARVRQVVQQRLQPGARLLELNAGSGLDAACFASQGYAVHATDIAPGMLSALRAKAADPALDGRLSVQTCSFTELEQVFGAPYDHVLSNMGGLNCTTSLAEVGEGLRYVLRPGGWATLVVMSPLCLWELAHLQLRRLHPGGVMAQVEGVRFKTYYHTPAALRRAMGHGLRLGALYGLGVFTPAADQKDFPARHPRLYRLLLALDQRLADWPLLRVCGDFFIAQFERLER